MPLRYQLQKAISILSTFQNHDGGIPAVLPGQNSGAWTTASCLESFLLCAYSPLNILDNCIGMVNFLLTAQLPGGGLPYVNASPISTLSTGHTLSSLILSKKYISDKNLLAKVNKAIENGFTWIESNQNLDGGWGVQPSLEGEGKLTRISSTYYALRPFWSQGISYNESDVIKGGIKLLLGSQIADGGWPFIQGMKVDGKSDVSNTARAILALIRSGYTTPNSEIINKGIGFLISQKLEGTSWRLGVEGFSSTTPAVTLYHNNSPCDALEALVCADYFGDETKEAFAWLLHSQREDGIWELTSPDSSQHDLERAWTWSTSEFIHVMNFVSGYYIKYKVDQILDRVINN
jgi:hypothetical protein